MIRILLNARFLPWLAALLAIVVTSNAWALNTGDIAGTVTDEEGIEVPGVTIVLSSPTGVIGGDKTTTSAEDGTYKFVELLAGKYKITASKEKFRGTTVTDIEVLVGQTQRVDLAMESGDSGEVIEVVDKKQTVDVENVTRGEVLTKDFLDKIPAGRTYQTAVQMAAGVTGGAGGNPNMGGGASNENTYMLDGVNITDPVTGTFSLNFNYDAIQQIEVLLGGYEPEYGVSLGGIVNLVTESGTNNLEFDTSVYYENGNWAPKLDARYSADGFQIAPTGFDSSSQFIQIGAKISGPVVRDRAWFIFSYEGARSLNSNVGIDLPRDYDGHYILAKLTVQPNSEHRLTSFVQLNPTTIDNTDQGTITIRPEAQGRQAQGGVVGQLRWQWFLSPNTNLDTMFVTQQQYLEVGGVPCTHDRSLGYNPCKPDEKENTTDWETPGRLGIYGAFDSVNYPYFVFDDRWRYSASTKLSVLSVKDPLKGQHDFKFGAEAIQTRWSNITGYTGNTEYIDMNNVPYDPKTFENYYYFEVSGPFNFTTSGSQWNLFAQDAYKPISNLTIKYGLRYDHTIQRNDIGDPVVIAGLLGPRAYAAWDPFGDNKTKIAGGYGRFNDTGRLSISDFTSLSSFGDKLFFGEGLGEFLNGSNQMYRMDPQTNPNLTNDKLRTPRVDELILLLQRQIIEDVSISSNSSYKMTRFLYEQDEVNLVYDEDGSAIIGSRYGDPLQSIQRLRTPQIARRNYVQQDFVLDKVKSHRWFGRLTYTYAQSIGTTRSALSGSFLNDPQTQYNYGNLYETDIRHQVKGYVAWSLPTDPWVQNIGASLQYYSGTPFERKYWDDNALGYGIRIRDRDVYGRLPGWWDFSVKFTQDLDVRKGKVVLDVEALNLFNNQQPADNDWYYIWALNRNFVVYRQDPLRLQVGVRYKF
jgi:hypothetical protein